MRAARSPGPGAADQGVRPQPAAATLSITWHGLSLQLAAERALWLPAVSTLLIADAHIGKAHAFRRGGVPVPAGTTEANLARLDGLLAASGARRLVFLGDLLHAAAALDAQVARAWCDWRARHAGIDMLLVEGNHDAQALRARALDAAWGLRVEPEPCPLRDAAGRALAWLCHHPDLSLPDDDGDAAALPMFCGHWHPSVRLAGRVVGSLRLPCFWFGARRAVLPAFGEFTGTHPAAPQPGDRLYAVADGRVLPLPTL